MLTDEGLVLSDGLRLDFESALVTRVLPHGAIQLVAGVRFGTVYRFGPVFGFVLCWVWAGVQFDPVFEMRALFGLVRYSAWSGVRFGPVFGWIRGRVWSDIRFGSFVRFARVSSLVRCSVFCTVVGLIR